jgi:hypothetical protein
MHMAFQEAVTYMTVTWPKAYNDRAPAEYENWPQEKRWALKTLDAGRGQLVDIQVAAAADGTYALTGHSAKQFSAAGKKDLAYACIYAYVRFLVWLKLGELEFGEGNEEESGYYVMQ